MVDKADLKPGSVVRLNGGSPKFTVERMDTVGVHLVGWADRVGIVRFVAKPELLCWPKTQEERVPPPEGE